MSLYADYIKEREDFETLETESGFVTYKCQGHECYLRDIYVVPEKRKSSVATDLANQVIEKAKSQGCTILLGSISPQAKTAKASHTILRAYGMKFLKETPSLIIYYKEI